MQLTPMQRGLAELATSIAGAPGTFRQEYRRGQNAAHQGAANRALVEQRMSDAALNRDQLAARQGVTPETMAPLASALGGGQSGMATALSSLFRSDPNMARLGDLMVDQQGINYRNLSANAYQGGNEGLAAVLAGLASGRGMYSQNADGRTLNELTGAGRESIGSRASAAADEALADQRLAEAAYAGIDSGKGWVNDLRPLVEGMTGPANVQPPMAPPAAEPRMYGGGAAGGAGGQFNDATVNASELGQVLGTMQKVLEGQYGVDPEVVQDPEMQRAFLRFYTDTVRANPEMRGRVLEIAGAFVQKLGGADTASADFDYVPGRGLVPRGGGAPPGGGIHSIGGGPTYDPVTSSGMPGR